MDGWTVVDSGGHLNRQIAQVRIKKQVTYQALCKKILFL